MLVQEVVKYFLSFMSSNVLVFSTLLVTADINPCLIILLHFYFCRHYFIFSSVSLFLQLYFCSLCPYLCRFCPYLVPSPVCVKQGCGTSISRNTVRKASKMLFKNSIPERPKKGVGNKLTEHHLSA